MKKVKHKRVVPLINTISVSASDMNKHKTRKAKREHLAGVLREACRLAIESLEKADKINSVRKFVIIADDQEFSVIDVE